MKSHYIVYLLSILLIFFACKKEDEAHPDYPSCRLLKEIQKLSFYENDTIYPYYEYVYEGNNLVKRILYIKYCVAGTYSEVSGTEHCGLSPSVLDSFIYKDGKPYENFRNPGDLMYIDHQRFFYSGDKLEKIKTVKYYRYNLNVINTTEESFEYNSEGVLDKSTIIYKGSDGQIVKMTKLYLYTINNLSRIDLKKEYSLDTNYYSLHYYKDTVTYGFEEFSNYDSGENPYKMMFFIDDLRNQSISASNYADYHAEINNINGSSVISNSNEITNHNSSGFPAKIGYFELIYDCSN